MDDKQTTEPLCAEELATQRALAALDEMARQWAKGVDLTRAVTVMLNKDDRETRLEDFIKQAFVEGAWCARHSYSLEQIEELGRGKQQ
jgi:hypothetical protein